MLVLVSSFTRFLQLNVARLSALCNMTKFVNMNALNGLAISGNSAQLNSIQLR